MDPQDKSNLDSLVKRYLDFHFKSGSMPDTNFHTNIINALHTLYGNGVRGLIQQANETEELSKNNNHSIDDINTSISQIISRLKEVEQVAREANNFMNNYNYGRKSVIEWFNAFLKICAVITIFLSIISSIYYIGRSSRDLEMRLISLEKRNE